MSRPNAFRASYSDLKLIKTRQCVQIVFELPLADFDAAYTVLGGMPNSASETWFAIAPLKLPQAEKENAKPVVTSKTMPATPQPKDKPAGAKREHMDWRELQPAAQAGIRCADVVFWAFLNEKHPYRVTHTLEASEAVRELCGVKSRAEFGTNHKARILWHQLDESFQAWRVLERA